MPKVESWREGLSDPMIQEILQFARERNLDLSVRRDEMGPWYIQVEERVDPDYVRKLARALREEGDWPREMPLPVVLEGKTVTLLDGSHRTTAARVAEFPVIPVLVVPWDTYWALKEKFDIPNFDLVHSILPEVDPLMRENERKDYEGGAPKKRSVDAWDVDALREEGDSFLGTIRRGSRDQRGTPKGHLYHSTFADIVPEIAREGLQPSRTPRWGGKLGERSLGKVFFSSHISTTAFYTAHHFSKALVEVGRSPDPILLRVSSEFLKDAEQDVNSWDDWFVERTVTPSQIEIWAPWSRKWTSLRSVASKVSGMETVRGEPEELEVDPSAGADVYTKAYIEQVWPKDKEVPA